MKSLVSKLFGKKLHIIRNKWRDQDRFRQIEINSSIPKYHLEMIHVQNAKLLSDREELLKLLPKNSICAEIGVNEGEFSQEIIKITSPEKLYLIDAWNDVFFHNGLRDLVAEKFRSLIELGKVQLKIGLSTDELQKFPNAFFDWVYLDTAHTYEITIAELNILKNKVKPGGLITGHDYVIGNWNDWYKYGVIEAVHELCVTDGWELVYLTNETHQHRSFAIRKL